MDTFQTQDGFRLYLVGGVWVDSLDSETVDLAFDCGPDGMPVDDSGATLSGHVVKDLL